jgi:flagellar protein FliS
MNSFGYQQYKQQAVNTMTQGELLLLLYDEIIKRLGMASLALKNNNYESFDKSLDRAVEIIRYLKKTLNRGYSVSSDILKMYDFFLYEISRIKAGRNLSIIDEIKPMILDLRNTFKEADRIAQAEAVR